MNATEALLEALALAEAPDGAAPEALDEAVNAALTLGFAAGSVCGRPLPLSRPEVSSFLMDPDLIVQAAGGDSILRLPWFEAGLFVGRGVPEIREMPRHVRAACVQYYRAALAGDRGRFGFTSYGHTYVVDAVPVRGDDDCVEAVLAVATPSPRRVSNHATGGPAVQLAARPLTRRETEVLLLASEGLTASQIAARLIVSVSTVRTHFENIYPKLGVSDRAAAVAAALRLGLID
jgi:DNA-binding CsgD family transcriptional regulator